MKVYHKFLLYQNKLLKPYVRILLGLIETLTYLASLLLIVGVIHEHGFPLSPGEVQQIQILYRTVRVIFLIDVTLYISLEYRNTKKQYQRLTWVLSVLLYLALVPVISYRSEEEEAILQVWGFLHGKFYHLISLLIPSLLNLSNDLVHLLGRRTNPSLMLTVGFMAVILVGTGLLILPRCAINDIAWVGSLFTAASAVCVTGLVPVDVSATFATNGLVVIILPIQIGGLGVMTLTSSFIMFFMGNASIYNQLVVRDMVSSNSLGSLLSTLLYILGFTLVIEGIDMVSIWFSIHGMLGMNLEEELVFVAFHSISTFYNAGFSTSSGNLGNSVVMTNHSRLFISVSSLIILGGIGFPILVNFRDTVLYHLRHSWTFVRTRRLERHKMQHLYNLNTKTVSAMTSLLLLVGTLTILAFEWNAFFAGMPVADKWTQAFFNATCPQTAGFSSVDLASLSVQILLVYLFLMWAGGGSQSAAGGVKVNVFAMVVLNLVAVLRGSERVEIFDRELSRDSIRRSNATVVMSLGILFLFIFILSILEPKTSLLALTFECISVLSTVESNLNLTPQLCNASKLLVSLLMFIGRVGLTTLMLGVVKQKKDTKYRYPDDNIIVN